MLLLHISEQLKWNRVGFKLDAECLCVQTCVFMLYISIVLQLRYCLRFRSLVPNIPTPRDYCL